jgi:hypothetical protein
MTTDPNTPTPRPVSLACVLAIFVLLSLFGIMAKRVYVHSRPPAPQNEAPDNLSKDMAWRATPETRRAHLADLRKKQAEQGASYAWVVQKTGVVQLPVARAMELVVLEHGGAK